MPPTKLRSQARRGRRSSRKLPRCKGRGEHAGEHGEEEEPAAGRRPVPGAERALDDQLEGRGIAGGAEEEVDRRPRQPDQEGGGRQAILPGEDEVAEARSRRMPPPEADDFVDGEDAKRRDDDERPVDEQADARAGRGRTMRPADDRNCTKTRTPRAKPAMVATIRPSPSISRAMVA